MRAPNEIKRDMKYPSPEVKTRCMNEVARYLRDAYKCGIYSEVLEKLALSRFYFGIDSNELMELLSRKYKCKEICDKTKLLKKLYMEKYEIEDDGDFQIPANFKYKFICERIIGKNLNYDNITCADIDDFIEGIELIKIPGVLYPLMWLTHAKNEEVFLYIYTKHVLPAFIKLSESGDINTYNALSSIMCGYIEELVIYVGGLGEVFITSIPGNTTWNEVIMKFQKTGEFECIRKANEKLKKADGIGMHLLKLYKKNKNILKSKYKAYVTNYFPMFAALVTFALLGEEKNKEAVEFMIDNYSDINEDNYQCAYVLMLLFKTILLCDNYEYMNILYADLQKEKLLYQRNYKDIYDTVIGSCEFIEELYLKIKTPPEDGCFDYLKRFVKETVFEEWGMIEDIRNIKNQYAHSQDKVKSDMFRRLYSVMRALSNPEGIYIALIAQTYGKNYRDNEFIRNIHHDDKISMVISWDDENRAKNLFLRLGDVDRGATSVRNRSFFERVDIVIKDILLEKLDADIESMLMSIKEHREKANYRGREDEFFTAVEPRIRSLTKRISAKYIDREQIVDFFVKLDDKGCWDKLDEECKSMMITSEIVYRTLISRGDAESLDYSPSMIPLTKVIEYILNDIYNKIKCNIVFDGPGMNIDSNSVRFFKDKNETEPKECLEMGPAIRVLSDGFLKSSGRGPIYSNYFLPKDRSRFEEWKGNFYVDWSVLKDFKGTKLNWNSFDKEPLVQQFVLGDDAEYNRKVLSERWNTSRTAIGTECP
ncbi:hypothetical protein [Acetivibrio straminisolvens]|uniref:Uncharacterized protein n=1 Tax=Acetivibrio straminisolvens JCM 21531 TaxID=1294263 RepID=W4VDV5_9FIRM|nr:hypothetical protein [Acetivibrio straminisolvens]GAE90914.1 hypothetical protein JCM21531_4574 [Acetivibrio straminisolvens JCM 21531]